MNNFFVTVNGNVIASNLNKKQAVNIAIREQNNDPELCILSIGIGKTKYKDGKQMYTLLPYNFYI